MATEEKETFEGGTALSPTSTVEISISCRDLIDKDLLSKSDPMCVVYHRPRRSNHWVELMRTEIIDNNLDPDFAKKVTTEYRFEMQQNLRFEVYDIDNPKAKLADQDGLGYVECTLAQIVSAGGTGLTLPLGDLSGKFEEEEDEKGNKKEVKAGTIILIAEELAALKDELHLTLGAQGIGSRSFVCIPPSTYYTISKVTNAGKYIVVHRGNRARSRNPTWQPAIISLSSLCNGDKERKLKFECFQQTYNREISLGFCVTTLNKLQIMGPGGLRLQKADGQEGRGTLLINSIKIAKIYTFVDYIQSGTQIHCCFAIDFTSSNGDPSETSSLHHFAPQANKPNPYEQAIQAVGNIIQDYDNTKLFPVYGFGARIPPVGAVSHNFHVTLSKNPASFGIHGVLESYRNCIRQIQLYGPTNFAPVIKAVGEIASQSKDGDDYYVLIIITDGVITDMPQTKEAIVNAAPYPLSIIIIGVGAADFDAMEELDGDSVRISYNGRAAERDIVQFVPYRDAYSWLASTSGPTSGSWVNENNADFTNRFAQSQLAAEVLAEIPDQLTGFMRSRGVIPQITSRAPSPAPSARKIYREDAESNPQPVGDQLKIPKQSYPAAHTDSSKPAAEQTFSGSRVNSPPVIEFKADRQQTPPQLLPQNATAAKPAAVQQTPSATSATTTPAPSAPAAAVTKTEAAPPTATVQVQPAATPASDAPTV